MGYSFSIDCGCFELEKLKVDRRPCFHNVGSYATAFLYFIETDTTIGTNLYVLVTGSHDAVTIEILR